MDLSHTSVILAFTLHIQIGNRVDLIPQFVSGCEPLDGATFVSEAMIPSHPEGSSYRNALTSRVDKLLEQEEKEASLIHYRSHEETSIQHFVGLLFRHHRYRYVGFIFGWDPVCAASEEWKKELGVNTLLRGETSHLSLFVKMECRSELNLAPEPNMFSMEASIGRESERV
ncbi:hypothetical protein MPER_02978, partial [Moniliophthora perniciosa FA553]